VYRAYNLSDELGGSNLQFTPITSAPEMAGVTVVVMAMVIVVMMMVMMMMM
jgi:type IV secretory pathway VirB3-like protein